MFKKHLPSFPATIYLIVMNIILIADPYCWCQDSNDFSSDWNYFSIRVCTKVEILHRMTWEIGLTLMLCWFNVYLKWIFKSDTPCVMCTMWMMIWSLISAHDSVLVPSHIIQHSCCSSVYKAEEILLNFKHSYRFSQYNKDHANHV